MVYVVLGILGNNIIIILISLKITYINVVLGISILVLYTNTYNTLYIVVF